MIFIQKFHCNINFGKLFPQTTLCNTALDNPTQRSKEQMITAALKFLETDTIWYGTCLFLFILGLFNFLKLQT